MKTRRLGKTGLWVSEIGFGGEWLERHSEEEGIELICYAFSKGINILDCWMADPKSRDVIGKGIKGMSSHNPKVAAKAAESGYVEMILFSINPAFDMLPASENIETMFADEFDAGLKGIDADRARLYKLCEQNDVGITVMKGFAGGRLFDVKRSPFGENGKAVWMLMKRKEMLEFWHLLCIPDKNLRIRIL